MYSLNKHHLLSLKFDMDETRAYRVKDVPLLTHELLQYLTNLVKQRDIDLCNFTPNSYDDWLIEEYKYDILLTHISNKLICKTLSYTTIFTLTPI